MRTFTDMNGTEWTVFEVRRQIPGAEAAKWSYLPEGYGEGWLCFESRFSKRRLMEFPERWREFSNAELESLLQTATPVLRPRGAQARPTREDGSEAR